MSVEVIKVAKLVGGMCVREDAKSVLSNSFF